MLGPTLAWIVDCHCLALHPGLSVDCYWLVLLAGQSDVGCHLLLLLAAHTNPDQVGHHFAPTADCQALVLAMAAPHPLVVLVAHSAHSARLAA